MKSNSNRRRKVIVDEQLQRRMIVSGVWPVAACYLVLATSLYVLYSRVTETAGEAGVVLEGVNRLFAGVLLLFVVAAVFSAFFAIRLSNRVAGPLYRFQQTMKQVREGDPKARATLRESDLLGNAANELNTFLDWVEGRAGEGSRTEAAQTAQTAQTETATAE